MKAYTSKRILLIVMGMSFLFLSRIAVAQVPQIINYQGRVSVNGTNFDGTGQFKFALLNGTGPGGVSLWSNGTAAVSVTVTKGLYSVLLGDTGIPNMSSSIPATVFTNADVRLRVWFDGGVGLQQMTPDRRLSAVGYALMAGNVSDGSVTSSKLAAGAVTTAAIANGAVGTSQLANYAITSLNIASNTITAANMAPGAGVVPSGAIVLSPTATNDALTTAGFAPLILTTNTGSTNWTQVTPAAPWTAREFPVAVVVNSMMWVLGGGTLGESGRNDVWSSSDGTNWTQVTPAAPWNPRWGHAAVVFNGKMWVLGGHADDYINDVWSSSDGTNWTQVTPAAPWSPRVGHAAVVLNGKMWVLGGIDFSQGPSNDVWSSSDGINWTQVTPAAPWSPRWGPAVVLNGKMWVLGGTLADWDSRTNDVWSSSDGTNWTQATPAAQWSIRQGPAAAVLNGQMWVLGGDASNIGLRKDVWSSSDGTNWTQATAAAPWSPREWPAAVVLNGLMWVLGGHADTNNNAVNDVWASPLNISTTTSNVMLGQYYLFQKQ